LALDLGVTPESAQHPIFTGHPLLLVSQGTAALCFAAAALLFSRQAEECENELLLWLGPACALGALARVNYVLFPSLYTDWLYTGDLLRTGFYVLLLVGAAREIRRYWSDQAELAVLEDRRRLARELHDGVIQELSFIKAQSAALDTGGKALDQIRGACERGLEEARAAVVALGAEGDEPLSTVLARAAKQLGEQYGVAVVLDLDESVSVDAEQRHALVRIAREALTNAVKHGGATEVEVVLAQGVDGRLLAVQDNGRGFDAAALTRANGAVRTGYGLVSMRERARALSGRLNILSEPGGGTEVTVTW
jgi:signal transduction histidine kinase